MILSSIIILYYYICVGSTMFSSANDLQLNVLSITGQFILELIVIVIIDIIGTHYGITAKDYVEVRTLRSIPA